jgi:hypothetical protein
MPRKTIFSIVIGILIGAIAYSCINVAIHWNDTFPEETQCFQAKVDDPAKPRAIVYKPSIGYTGIWKGTCEADVLPKVSTSDWKVNHFVQVAVAGIMALVLLVVGVCAVLFFVIIAPFVALYRWTFKSYYEDDSLLSVYLDIVKNP